MELKTTAKEFVEVSKKTTEEFKKFFGTMVFEGDFEPEHLEMLQNLFGTIELLNKLVATQAEMIQEINEKLDKLSESK